MRVCVRVRVRVRVRMCVYVRMLSNGMYAVYCKVMNISINNYNNLTHVDVSTASGSLHQELMFCSPDGMASMLSRTGVFGG